MNFRSKYRPDPVGFQLAPMIDVVFLLLCFFVTSQIFTQWEAEIDISLPVASTAKVEQRLPAEIILNVLKDGTVVVNGRKLTEDELAALLQRLVTRVFEGKSVPVILRADKETIYQHVIGVLDLCRRAGVENISFATGVSGPTAAP